MHTQALVPTSPLTQARWQLVERGTLPSVDVEAHVAQSWHRSWRAGLLPVDASAPAGEPLGAVALQRAQACNRDLISHSRPVMEHLFEQVRQSHSMVILSDAQGVLMHTLGELDFLNKAQRVALCCGASWAEDQRGTNAIGTALVESRPIEIHGTEHYLDCNGFLTCAAAPILSAQGQLVGVLDISGDHRSRHPHTLGLVSTAAQMIENSLMLATCRHQTLVQLHPCAEGVGSVAQGLLAFADDGRLTGANRKGLAWLGLTLADVGQVHWPQVFDGPAPRWWGPQAQVGTRPQRLHTVQGVPLYAQVQQRLGLARPATPLATPPVRDALTQLDSGDLRWRSAADKARKVVDKGIPLLVLGESGVGKELFAQALHQSSSRRDKPFVAVNCAALPEHLIEAELFGYVPGAFTGASRHGAPGRLRQAHGGTLFLDEIGDMPLALQTRLLRVLQERQITPLGGSTATALDVNLVCATHHPLKDAVAQGRFRADLYYRINGLTVTLPPLRERTDFGALCARVLQNLAPEPLTIAPEVMAALQTFDWPGNLRQLSHVLRTAVALLEPDSTDIGWSHLPEDVVAELCPAVPPDASCRAVVVDGPSATPALRDMSLQAMERALAQAHGNVSAAARQLGISRQTLYRKLGQRKPLP